MYFGYKHWTLEEPPRCFNVGKGHKHRPNDKRGRNHKWYAIVKRYGLRVEICIGPVSNEEVCAWETRNIELMGTFSTNHSHDDINDIGCNFTKGGEGTPGRIVTIETRAKISARLKGRLKGRRLTDEHRRKIGLSQRGKPHPQTKEGALKISKALRGRKLSKTARENISLKLRKAWTEGRRVGKPLSEEAKKRRLEKIGKKLSEKAFKRKVEQLDKDGNVVAQFSSIKEASIATDTTCSCIINVCAGRRKTTKGFHWRYVEDSQ